MVLLHTMWANDVRPYGLFGRVCCAAKSLRSLRIYVVLRDRKAVQVYASMLVLFDVWVLCAFWICTAPLSRLTPMEALPQAPLGALPPDPHNGFHPLTLTRGVPLDLLLASLGVLFYSILVICSVGYAHSSLLIYPCSICHTPQLSSPISPPKYHQAYQSFPISTSNLLPLLTVYSFWLYRQGKVYPAFVR